jgi:uroporphyrinogen III methyltransferase/synthase
LTHRGLASSFAVVTGHEDLAKEASKVNWAGLARAADTLVILMGLENLRRITRDLVTHGRCPETPVAVVRHGSTEAQETLVGTLADIATQAERAGFMPPVTIVIGEVVRLRDRIHRPRHLVPPRRRLTAR